MYNTLYIGEGERAEERVQREIEKEREKEKINANRISVKKHLDSV